jgi:hypothetical protein
MIDETVTVRLTIVGAVEAVALVVGLSFRW